ncbi:hypothetical protein Tco_1563595 [Tanacetum coccineum]
MTCKNNQMPIPNIQLNSKFVNNMSPKWDRFVTAVKLNKGLKETNHEQLYAYLKQHEKHAAQDRLIIERITPSTNDPLAFVSNVPSSEEDLELAELTRQKMHEKLNDPVCVEKGIKCIPPNYSKENFLATFTPQTKLTPEQYVCWFLDLAKRKTERVKANAPPLPVLPPATVYPPNTPVSICPPSNAFQPQSSKYSKFDVITHYIWTLKRLNAFDGVKKSLVTEVRAMKAVFEEMEAEVDQNAIDKKYGEIERKNLLITNENLIANCIAQDVFYTVTDSTLSASRFNDLSTAYNAINHELFSKLEVAHVNLHLKQHLKENANNLKSKSPRDVLEFDVFFELGMRDDQIQSHKNTIRKLKAQISELKANKSTCPKDFGPRDKQNAYTNLLRKKRVNFVEPCETSTHDTPPQVEYQKINSTNASGIPSTGVKGASVASGSKARSTTKKDRTLPDKSA